jgi:hypothetical protein
VAAGAGGLFGPVGAVKFPELFFVTACLGGDSFQSAPELVDLDL